MFISLRKCELECVPPNKQKTMETCYSQAKQNNKSCVYPGIPTNTMSGCRYAGSKCGAVGKCCFSFTVYMCRWVHQRELLTCIMHMILIATQSDDTWEMALQMNSFNCPDNAKKKCDEELTTLSAQSGLSTCSIMNIKPAHETNT